MRTPIYVVGYPKSGNTWLSRLLGEALDSPVRNEQGKLALADEGYKRKGNYVIRQLHLESCPKEKGSKVVFIVRDPRDVTVSVCHYWQMKSLIKAIRTVGEGRWPVPHGNGLPSFVSKWLMMDCVDTSTRYEDLSENTAGELNRILSALGEGVDHGKIVSSVTKQSFKNKRREIEISDYDDFPHGRNIQLRNMRKGVVGDWMNNYNIEHAKLAHKLLYTTMVDLGYEDDEEWWKKI